MPYAGFTARAATKPSPPRDWCCTRRASCRRTDGAGERPQSASEAGLCRRVRAMADGPQLRQIHLASSRQQGPGLGPLAGVGSAAGSGGRRFDAVSATRRTALPVLQSRPSSERHGRHAPHPLRRCRTGDSFLAQILREDFNATGDAGDATLNPVIPATNRDAVHANVGAAQFVDMRRGGHVACPLQNRCRVIACCG